MSTTVAPGPQSVTSYTLPELFLLLFLSSVVTLTILPYTKLYRAKWQALVAQTIVYQSEVHLAVWFLKERATLYTASTSIVHVAKEVCGHHIHAATE